LCRPYGVWLLVLAVSGCSWTRTALDDRQAEVRNLVERARSAEENGQLDSAAELLHQAIEEQPDDPDACRSLADVLAKQGEAEQAAHFRRLAVEQTPDDVMLRVQLAGGLLELQQYEEAQSHVRAALDREPHHAQALMHSARIAEHNGQPEQALDAYLNVLALEPGQIEASLRAAELQLRLSRPDQACPMLRSVCGCAQACTGDQAQALWLLGVAYGCEKRWSDASRSFAEAVAHGRSMTADDWYRLAYVRYQTGDVDGALSEVAKALSSEPAHSHARMMAESLKAESAAKPQGIVWVGYTTPLIPVPAGW
jgi:tetratricopeptide (TPR) repeat protein